jgi:hypothetical protein
LRFFGWWGGVHMAQLLRNFKGGLRKVLQKVTKGGEGVQNGEKMRYVIFERPLWVNIVREIVLLIPLGHVKLSII